MKKFKNLIFVIPILCIIFSFICIPVSAESSFEVLPISLTKLWPEDLTYTQVSDNYISVKVPYPSLANQVSAIWTCHNDDLDNYYNYKFVFVTSIIDPYNFTCTFNGTEYEVKKDNSVDNTYFVQISNVKVDTSSARLDFNFSFSSNTSGYLYFMGYYQYSDVNPIINNQNQNASDIQANQDKNTSEILNGWHNSEDSPSEDSFNDFNSVESDLLDSTQSNANNASVEVNDSFLGSLQRYFSSLSAIAAMFSDMMISKIPDLSSLAWFSLAMGSVPLIVGSTIFGLRSRDRAAARERYRNDYKRGYNAGYNKGKGG